MISHSPAAHLKTPIISSAAIATALDDFALDPELQAEMRRVLVFSIAGRARCCAVEDVREVVPITPTTRLPGAPPFVRGLINLRGTLVTVLDAAMHLYGVATDDAVASILLVDHRERVAGVIVDNVFDIQSIPVAELDDGSMLDLLEMVGTALA